MNALQKLSLLAVALAAVSCNEKVSPELGSSGATDSSSSTTPVAPGEYYFSVTNTSDVKLNYKLHKTGAGNSTTPCEVKNTVGLSSDIFRGSPAANDITCYFEAEELSLYHQGMNFQINASPNTCDFVGYSPFSFYDQIPGDSSDSLIQVTCGSDTTAPSHVATAATADGLDLGSTTGAARCNDWVTESLDSATRRKFQVQSDQDLCRFNYAVNKCDIGKITVRNYNVTYTPPGDDPTTQPAILKSEFTTRTVDCGGKIANCVKGPIEHIQKGVARFTEIGNTVINKTYAKEYKLPGLIGPEYSSVKKYVNFRRNLASTQLDYGDSAGASGAYKSTFGDPILGKTFNPNVMDYFSNNLRMDGSTLVDDTLIETYSYPNNAYKAVPLAADPFLGIAQRTNPFYTFYCFDNAFDIKARIRMVVREWDRVFPSVADNEYISDIFRGANSRQDNDNYVELPDEHDQFINFNDMTDWDDHIPMSRTPGFYAPGTTMWTPEPAGLYVDGFFNPLYFTNIIGL